MKYEITQDAVENIAATANLDPEEDIRTAYSGRAMYGNTCLGLVGGTSEFSAFLFAARDYLTENDTRFSDDQDVLDAFGSPTTDSMAGDTIFYWTNVTVTD